MSETKVIYMAAPCGAETEAEHCENLRRAHIWFMWCADQDVAVVADWILYAKVWNDFDPKMRAKGLDHDDAMIKCCHEFWMVGGKISPGMQRGKETAEQAGIPVVDHTGLGEEPPPWKDSRWLTGDGAGDSTPANQI